jgi:hypothetical protein
MDTTIQQQSASALIIVLSRPILLALFSHTRIQYGALALDVTVRRPARLFVVKVLVLGVALGYGIAFWWFHKVDVVVG